MSRLSSRTAIGASYLLSYSARRACSLPRRTTTREEAGRGSWAIIPAKNEAPPTGKTVSSVNIRTFFASFASRQRLQSLVSMSSLIRSGRIGGPMLLGLFVAQAAALAGGILTARFLGPIGRGQLALTMLVPVILPTIVDFGVERAAVFRSGVRREDNATLAGTLLLFAALTGCLGFAISIVVSTSLTLRAQPEGIRTLAALASLMVPLSLLSKYGQAQLQGRLKLNVLSAVRITEPTCYLAMLTLLIMAHGLSVSSAINARLVSQFAVIGWSWFVVVRESGFAPPQWMQFWALARYGIRGYFRQLSPLDTFQLDQWVVGLTFGAAALAYYVVALAVLSIVRVVPTALGAVIVPHRTRGLNHDVKLMVLAGLTLGVVAAGTGIIAIGAVVPALYGGGFNSAVAPARFLLLGAPLLVARELGIAVLLGSNRPGRTSLVEVASSSALVAGLALFSHLWYLNGVAIAVSVSYGAGAAVVGWPLLRQVMGSRKS